MKLADIGNMDTFGVALDKHHTRRVADRMSATGHSWIRHWNRSAN